EVILENGTAWRGIPEPEPRDGLVRQATPLQVPARLQSSAPAELRLEKRQRCLEHGEQSRPLILPAIIRIRCAGHWDTGLCRQPFHGFRERQPLGLHQEREDVTVLAGRKAVIEALL